jgi:hypothetical protein
MKIVLCLAAMITLLLSAGGPLRNPAVAAPTGKCVAFCRDWCATHARAQDYCNARCTATHCS